MNPYQFKTSTNFDFLKDRWPDLASLASFAESYAYTDPASSLVKLRIFAEKMVDILYYELGLIKPNGLLSFRELLHNPEFGKAVPNPIINFLDLIRKEGNKGAHEDRVHFKPDEVIRVLSNVHKISAWFVTTLTNTKIEIHPFLPPEKPPSISELKKKQEELEEKLEKLQKNQDEKRFENPHQLLSETQKEDFQLKARKMADSMGLTEAQTRKLLIDSLLLDAGWELLKNPEAYNPHKSKPQALPEYPIKHQPTASGTGYADYVLMGSNGKPIAVIEAKNTSRSAEDGQAQAKLYADGIEKETGQRPFIFFTNGHDIFFQDVVNGYPHRRVWGFYDQEKLEYLLFQGHNRKTLKDVEINTQISGRDYQLECIRRVYESFDLKHRKGLIVMATGTGKTRVAVSLIDGLMRAKWTKRILFLVDRKELRKQAIDAFKEHMPDETPVVITSGNKFEQNNRLYFATYQTMIEAYQAFNIGFFDLIIADESHRSIYKTYRELFLYFDALQIGLTATPVGFINRNTFNFFGLTTTDPTYHYSYEEAVNHNPPYLVRYVVDEQSTGFLRRGMKEKDFTQEQREQLEEQGEDPDTYDFEPSDMDKLIMNRDTNRQILKNLMEKGFKDETGTKPGKTIIFARNHKHALLLAEIFNELYPQFEGKIAQVIDSHIERSEELIEGFKGKKKEFKDLDIAISVDMLDTGIDVPEIVNLVFAKPIYSKVKFLQMIGRGTRLCPKCKDLCTHKSQFMIFDPWRNFQFFDINPDGKIPKEQPSLPERLFSARLALFQTIQYSSPFVDTVYQHLRSDIEHLPEKSVTVRERWQVVEKVQQDKFWDKLLEKPDAESFQLLTRDITPLMRWRNISDEADALGFDNKITRAQLAWAQGNQEQFKTYQDEIISDVERLRTNLNQVKPQLELIESVQKTAYWESISLEKLEELRLQLRGLMKYRRNDVGESGKFIDVVDYVEAGNIRTPIIAEPMAVYKERLVKVVQELMANNLTLQKIHRGMAITETELQSLQGLILENDSSLKPEDLEKLYPKEGPSLKKLVRSIIGLDKLAVHERFEAFRKGHTTLSAKQMQFLTLVEQEIVKAGGLEIDKLYADPFTLINFRGVDGLFKPQEVDELLTIIKGLSA
ncbi:MAG: DEAD/DEAH box helicase family protein [Cyanobacteria bacterium]|nr:DEAD/DEAH box helicase family protein [Cyanobacteriota bacterium]